jgi:hypothetical protein
VVPLKEGPFQAQVRAGRHGTEEEMTKSCGGRRQRRAEGLPGMVDAKADGRDATLDAVQAIVRRLSIVVESKILANQKPWVSLPLSAKMSGKQKAVAKSKEMSQEGTRNTWFCQTPSLNLS